MWKNPFSSTNEAIDLLSLAHTAARSKFLGEYAPSSSASDRQASAGDNDLFDTMRRLSIDPMIAGSDCSANFIDMGGFKDPDSNDDRMEGIDCGEREEEGLIEPIIIDATCEPTFEAAWDPRWLVRMLISGPCIVCKIFLISDEPLLELFTEFLRGLEGWRLYRFPCEGDLDRAAISLLLFESDGFSEF